MSQRKINTLLSLFAISVASTLPSCSKSEKVSLPQYGHSLNWQSTLKLDASRSLKENWNIKVGEGRSQIVGGGNQIYVATGAAEKDDPTQLTTRISCLDLDKGDENWAFSMQSEMTERQETFRGRTPAPQATPLIADENLIAISFTGQIVCLNRRNGKSVWQKDLVKDFGASPVQFGFSSSPMTHPKTPGCFYVLAAGYQAGLYCLKVDDGSIVWKAKCKTSSYATPVAANIDGVDQWIVVSERRVLGFSNSNGDQLWEFELPNGGLTNVPTPLVVDGSRIVLSGQGCGGTRCIDVSRKANQWIANEVWSNRKVQLFYTNWVNLNERVIVGCTDKFMAALDVTDGSVLGRWRGFGDGNIALTGGDLVVVDGKGELSLLELSISEEKQLSGLRVTQAYKVLDARCWTPISIIGDKILVRGEDQLACFSVAELSDTESLENLISETKELEFESKSIEKADEDPVQKIFTTFETKGQDAALMLYSKLRKENKLDEAARIKLATSANEQGIVEISKLILAHAKEDFPNSEAIASAASSILGKN